MKKTYCFLLLLAIFSFVALDCAAVFAQTTELVPDTRAEIQVAKDGVTRINGFKVLQRAGSSYFGRLYWGDSYLRVSVRGNSKTVLQSRFGEVIKPEAVQIGDILSAEGEILSGTSEFSVNASKITHLTYAKNHTQFEGTILDIHPKGSGFELATKTSILSVRTGTTTVVHKGSRYGTGSLSLLEVGDRILRVTGIYDRTTNTLDALDITAYFNAALLKPQTWRGTLVETPSAAAKQLVVKINDQTFTLELSPKTELLTAGRKKTTLARFVQGDILSFYGARQEASPQTIDVEVVRDLDL